MSRRKGAAAGNIAAAMEEETNGEEQTPPIVLTAAQKRAAEAAKKATAAAAKKSSDEEDRRRQAAEVAAAPANTIVFSSAQPIKKISDLLTSEAIEAGWLQFSQLKTENRKMSIQDFLSPKMYNALKRGTMFTPNFTLQRIPEGETFLDQSIEGQFQILKEYAASQEATIVGGHDSLNVVDVVARLRLSHHAMASEVGKNEFFLGLEDKAKDLDLSAVSVQEELLLILLKDFKGDCHTKPTRLLANLHSQQILKLKEAFERIKKLADISSVDMFFTTLNGACSAMVENCQVAAIVNGVTGNQKQQKQDKKKDFLPKEEWDELQKKRKQERREANQNPSSSSSSSSSGPVVGSNPQRDRAGPRDPTIKPTERLSEQCNGCGQIPEGKSKGHKKAECHFGPVFCNHDDWNTESVPFPMSKKGKALEAKGRYCVTASYFLDETKRGQFNWDKKPVFKKRRYETNTTIQDEDETVFLTTTQNEKPQTTNVTIMLPSGKTIDNIEARLDNQSSRNVISEEVMRKLEAQGLRREPCGCVGGRKCLRMCSTFPGDCHTSGGTVTLKLNFLNKIQNKLEEIELIAEIFDSSNDLLIGFPTICEHTLSIKAFTSFAKDVESIQAALVVDEEGPRVKDDKARYAEDKRNIVPIETLIDRFVIDEGIEAKEEAQ